MRGNRDTNPPSAAPKTRGGGGERGERSCMREMNKRKRREIHEGKEGREREKGDEDSRWEGICCDISFHKRAFFTFLRTTYKRVQ